MGLRHYFLLLRVHHWIKNLLIFLPLFFSLQLFVVDKWLVLFLGFVSFCLVSSANYAINDLVDRRRDLVHPEKKLRPLAAGHISTAGAVVYAMLLLSAGLLLGWFLGLLFFFSAIGLFVSTQIYSFWLKKEAFADIILISINLVIRANAGVFLISGRLSYWLLVGVFFLGLFVFAGKRHADALALGKEAESHKKTLRTYTPEVTGSLMMVSTALLIATYSLYTFLSDHPGLLLTLPFALYVILRYFSLVLQGHKIGRKPQLGVTDFRMVCATVLWVLTTGIILYLPLVFS